MGTPNNIYNMRYLIILALLMTLLASSCNEDSFSQTVDIPLPDHEPLPALTLDLRSGDTAIYHRLVLSRGILEQDDDTPRDMRVQVFRDGAPFAEQSFRSSSAEGRTNEIELETPLSADAARYRVVATVEGFEPVEAEQEMPARPEYVVATYEPDGAITADGYRVDEVEIDLTDNGATEDYYGFRVLLPQVNCRFDDSTGLVVCENDFTFQQEAYLESPDPLLNNSSGFGLVVTDQSFNGATYRIRFTVENYTDARPRLEVYHLTEDAYRYATSRRAYEDAGDNPFAEPVNVHQNMMDGYGYFILSNRVVEEL